MSPAATQAGGPRVTSAPSPTVVDLPSGELPAPPAIEDPPPGLTTAELVDVTIRLTQDLPRDGRFRLRLYVNGELLRDRRLPRRNVFAFPDVPLVEGVNSITTAVSGPNGEGLHSRPLELERDTTPPTITVLDPPPGAIYAEEVTIRGTAEPGSMLEVTNRANLTGASLSIGTDGTFEFSLALSRGHNDIVLESRDAAGNTHRTRLSLERREGSASVSLSVPTGSIAFDSLPTTLTIRARVFDPAGEPIDGAEVTLSISPPGLPTQTHVAISRGGMVTWSRVRIAREGAQTGQGLVTVLAVLPSGETLQESQFFTIE
jgi:hypothetical protein